MFSKREEVKSIGNPAGIGKGTGFGLRERDGIGLGHYRLRAMSIASFFSNSSHKNTQPGSLALSISLDSLTFL